jgi:glutaconate CoA-transferase, subunit B
VPEEAFTTDEMMTVAAARQLRNGTVCFVGIGLPSEAADLARRLHAPECVLIYESGCIGAKPSVLPLSIGDGELADTADDVVSVPEIFNYWLQGGRIDVGFLGAAQIDRFGNLNTTTIGPYGQPTVRLPGTGGAPEIASSAKEVIVVLRHSRRTFIEHLDFVSSAGYLWGKGAREQLGLLGAGPTVVITDLGVLTPDPDTRADPRQRPPRQERRRRPRGHRLGAARGRPAHRDGAAHPAGAGHPPRAQGGGGAGGLSAATGTSGRGSRQRRLWR